MVLRGSNIVPPSLQDAETAVQRAQEILDRTKDELNAAKQSIVMDLGDEAIKDMSKAELIHEVQFLRNRLEKLELKQREARSNLTDRLQDFQKTLSSLLCGGAAGAIARTTVAPLDRVKILIQTAHLSGTEAKYNSILGTARQIVKDEGFLRLWRGNFTNCIRVVPHTATQFVSYDFYKPFLIKEGQEMNIPTRLMAGALSGMTAASVTHPMDVVRIRLQTQPELKGIMDSVRSVHAENGMRTFYKGYTPAMLSLSPFIAINFASFDTMKTWYYGDIKMTKKELKQRNPAVILGLGAFAGIIAQTACYPLDTVRRRMQMKGITYTSTANAFSTILKDEGMRGFYKGMSANAMKVVPNNAIRFAAYEILKGWFATDEAIKRRKTAWGAKKEQPI